MDLISLKKYLQERGTAPLSDIALHFATEPETARPLLDLWIGKGKVEKLIGASGGACKGCCKCDPAMLESYKWLG
ncbi:MAG: FeoC-like transcriptional regulator [Desulfobulbaceae bacterium]|nr:FeoC-like transcriptional regulator [Desulfobulbaceae bacterium]